MMKKRRKICVWLASLALGACILGGGISLYKGEHPTVAVAESVVSGDVAHSYVIGDTLSFAGSKISHNDKEYDATVFVTFPSGKRVQSEKVTLTEAGRYEVLYKHVSDGLFLEKKKEFSVSDKLFEVGNEKSSAVYTDFQSSFGDKGIVVSLVGGDTFRYNRILDLSDVGASDKIIQFFHNPSIPGAADASIVQFILTDAYDPENYVTITSKYVVSGGVYGGMYMTVNAAHQLGTGMTPTTADSVAANKVLWRGQYYIMQQGNRYGTWFGYSFFGTPSSGNGVGSECLEFSTDGTAFFGMNGKFLADLGDKDQFVDIWTGFTTGEVYLSVVGSGYEKSKMNFVIPAILDHDLSADGLADKTAPLVELDWDKEIPDAIVGKAYSIFGVKTLDDYTAEPLCQTRVYYNYYSSTRSRVEIIDGAFIPKYTGTYTIEYEVKDDANNRTVLTVDVVAREDIEPMSVEIGSAEKNFSVGDTVRVGEPSITSEYEDVSVLVEALLKGGDVVYTLGEDFTFIPFYDGAYTIRYTIKNYVECVTEEYEIQVGKTNKQYIFDEATLPKYFIKDAVYILPELTFYDFAGGEPVAKKANVSVVENGEMKQLTSNRYKVAGDGEVEVIYTTQDGTDSATYTVPVVDVGYGVRLGLMMDKYFVGSGTAVQTTDTNLLFSAAQAGTVSAEFINALAAEEVVVSFSMLTNLSNFKALHFYLTDSANAGERIKLSYRLQNGQVLFSVNGGKETIIDTKVTQVSSLEFSLDYANFAVTQFSGVSTKVDTYLSGDKFVGFTSEYVYLSVEMESAAIGAGFELFKINNQLFNNASIDGIEPRIYAENIRGYKVVGSEVTIKGSKAVDVLCPTVTYSIVVEDPNGDIVLDTNGIKMDETADPSIDHVIKLEQAGKYVITLTATDSMDNMTPYTFIITVTDITPPTLELSGMVTEADLGDNVKIAKAQYDKEDVAEIFVVVIAPDSSMTFVEGEKFKVTQKGVYYVSYYATDAAGNVTIESYKLTVK